MKTQMLLLSAVSFLMAFAPVTVLAQEKYIPSQNEELFGT